MFFIPDEDYRSPRGLRHRLHHVVVLDIQGDTATVVSPYHHPLLMWKVPIECFHLKPSAFRYLGTTKGLAWIRPSAWIAQEFTTLGTGEAHARILRIQSLTEAGVLVATSPRAGRIPGSSLVEWDLFTRSRRRPATREEIREAERLERRFNLTWVEQEQELVDEPLARVEPEPTPVPELKPEPPRPRRSRHARLAEDED